jgi:hypothetical protein
MRAEIDALVAELGQDIAQSQAEPSASGPFRGKPLDSRYSGVCAVCRKPYAEGDRIVWNGEAKRAAHLGCGQADAGAR